jgi:hypothetical protein
MVTVLSALCIEVCMSASLKGIEERKGMALLEYQAMPSLNVVAHYGVCVHSVIDQPQTGTSGVVHQSKRNGLSIMHKITPCWIILLLPARWGAVLGQPSRLQPLWLVH